MKADLTHVHILTPAELRERRMRGGKMRPPPKLKPKRRNKLRRPRRGNRVIVSSISLLPELKVRAERDLGRGNFSRAVTLALTYTLLAYDEGRLDQEVLEG